MTIQCPCCGSLRNVRNGSRPIRKDGKYRRVSDGQIVQRFCCERCNKRFSQSTSGPFYRQKKRHKNYPVLKLLGHGCSQREAAKFLRLNRKTVVQKFLLMASRCELKLQKSQQYHAPALEVEFDDLETFEHTKCKPLSVTLMVEHKTRRILGFEVARMPAKGHLAKISRKKYGPRIDERPLKRAELFEKVREQIYPHALIRSDSNPHYTNDVKLFFPKAKYQTILGKRGAMTGQGELKKIGFDPIFSLNHTCAMMRANVNRLFRRTWCTTKCPDRLKAHLMIYAWIHNERLRLNR